MKQKFFNFLKKNHVYEYIMNMIGGPTDIDWNNINSKKYIQSIMNLAFDRGYLNDVDRIFLTGLAHEWEKELNKPQYTIDNIPNSIEVEGIKYRLVITKNKDKYAACYMQFIPDAKCIVSDKPFHRKIEDALQDMCDLLNE